MQAARGTSVGHPDDGPDGADRVSPPLLGSKIRNDMLRAFLRPAPGDLVVDLGCGSGRTLLWNRDWGAQAIGIDISPFFSEDARRDVDLLLGDLRRLPFGDGTFTKAYSLDVLEHLSPEALRVLDDRGAAHEDPGRKGPFSGGDEAPAPVVSPTT